MSLRRADEQSELAQEFANLCEQHTPPPDVFAFLESAQVQDAHTQAEVLMVDQACRIARGCCPPAEEYLAKAPLVANSKSLGLKLVLNEYCERVQFGEHPSVDDLVGRFPQFETEIRRWLTSSQSDQMGVDQKNGEETIQIPLSSILGHQHDLEEDEEDVAPGGETIQIPLSSILGHQHDLEEDEEDVAPGEETIQVPLSAIITSKEDLENPADETIEVSLASILNPINQVNLKSPTETHRNATGDKTIEIPSEELPTSDSSKSKAGKQPRTTVEWAPDDRGQESPGNSTEDGVSSTSDATLQIDPASLSAMMDQFGTVHDSEIQTSGSRTKGRADFPDTMFDEGMAYDSTRKLEQFGDYELLGEIARGGMGVVFKARQQKLKRIVALKMILAGKLAGEDDIRRFYVEAESAAALDHPNIVPIYEVGEHRGQHYFSMGFVEGQSLADKVAENPLPPREAASLMKSIAEGVEYAHQHGVIHRDLKPANVLLDAQGHPKITDFGLAKRTETKADLTSSGQIMGTPNYMSPEQTTGNSSLVGPQSDVYSLGAMLYCLITGRPPFQAPTILELLQQVKLQEPVSPKRLTPNLPVDLETVCLKCLAKEPERRYASAQELVEDLDRFLKNIPVLARPVGHWERAWRWCKRYPVVAGLMAAVVLSLSLGIGFSTHYAIDAGHQAKEAMAQSVRAEENFHRAERNYRKAQAAVNQFFVQVSDNTLLNQPGMQPLQHELLKQALEYYQEFLEERNDDPDLQDELAMTHFRVGLITEAIESPAAALPSFEKARKIQTTLLEESSQDVPRLQALGATLTALGRVVYRTRDLSASEAIYQQALKIRQQVASLEPNDAEAKRELANAHMNLGLLERDRALSAEDANTHRDILNQARTLCATAQSLRGELLQQQPLSKELLRKLYRDLGQGAYNLGNLHQELGQQEPAFDHYREAARYFEQALSLDPDDQRNTLQMAICYRQLGNGQSQHLEQAWEYYQQALARLEPLVRRNPRIDEYRKELVKLELELIDVAAHLQPPQDSKAHLREARQHVESLLQTTSDDAQVLLNALKIYRLHAERMEPGRPLSQVFPALDRIPEIAARLRAIVEQSEAAFRFKSDASIEFLKLGEHLRQHRQLELALQLSQTGVSLTGSLKAADPESLNEHFNHHFALNQLASLFVDQKDDRLAQKTYEDLLTALRDLEQQIGSAPEYDFERAKIQYETAKAQTALAAILVRNGESVRAGQTLQAAHRLLQGLMAKFPDQQAVFQSDLDVTRRLLKQLADQPAVAEKP